MKRFLKPVLIITAVLLVLALGAGLVIRNLDSNKEIEEAGLPNYPRQTISIKGETITLLVTRTEQERRLGLGAVTKLPKNYGMLFDADGQMGIWMKGMAYPIDILWLDDKGKILHIVREAQPSSYPKTTFVNPAGTEARYVVELNAAEAARLKLEPGSTLPVFMASPKQKN